MWRERYTPFGQKLINPSANKDNTGYTSHIDDASSGLTYMQARYYDPNIGRFLVNDPVGFSEGGPAYFNRYAYTANDPINFFDPDGRVRRDANGRIIFSPTNNGKPGPGYDPNTGTTYVEGDPSIDSGIALVEWGYIYADDDTEIVAFRNASG